MTTPQALPARDYARIETAIELLAARRDEAPVLDDIAAQVGLSPFHFQRLFKRWAGISPKRFQQYLSVDHAKTLLAESSSVLDASYATGLSGPSRLHDLFVACEAMTPGEYKAQGADLVIHYGFHPSPFGECLIYLTDRGLCGLGFVVGEGRAARQAAHADLASNWSRATFTHDDAAVAGAARRIFAPRAGDRPLTLLLKGTNFQIRVWEALLAIPPGHMTTYEALGQRLGLESHGRAVGNAVAHNAISWIIPCHRVIRKTGLVNHYRWGSPRKRAMLAWEAAHRAPSGDIVAKNRLRG
jgi:AraC family transcriptional regulator of adaptative response/methylated-DNA-[protein]-cysteine methyltransferase